MKAQDYERLDIVAVDGQSPIRLWLPSQFVRQWSLVFDSLTVSEVSAFVNEVMVPDTRWTNSRLADLRLSIAGTSPSARRRLVSPNDFGPEAAQTDHHIIPDSRGGKRRGNITALPRDFHAGWHDIFGNCTPPEVPVILARLMRADLRWSTVDVMNVLNDIRHQTDGITRYLRQTG